MTRDYIFSLEEGGVAMPPGPVLLQIDSVVGALQTEVRAALLLLVIIIFYVGAGNKRPAGAQ